MSQEGLETGTPEAGDASRLGAQEHPLLGYFDSAEQERPTFDPGPDVPCVICYKPLSAPLMTLSAMKPGGSRSYFYRAHKACYRGLSEREVEALEWSMLTPPAAPAAQEASAPEGPTP
jgi:hypothetical protein